MMIILVVMIIMMIIVVILMMIMTKIKKNIQYCEVKVANYGVLLGKKRGP